MAGVSLREEGMEVAPELQGWTDRHLIKLWRISAVSGKRYRSDPVPIECRKL